MTKGEPQMSRLRSLRYSPLHCQIRCCRKESKRKQSVTIKKSPVTVGLVLLLAASNPLAPVGSVGELGPVGKTVDTDRGAARAHQPAADDGAARAPEPQRQKAITGEHDQVRELEHALVSAEDLLHRVAQERDSLRDRLQAMASRLSEIVERQETGRRVEFGLRWKLERLENQLTLVSSRREKTERWLKDWLLGSVQALEQLFDGTGVDVEELVARAADSELGQGGPLQVADIALLPPAANPVALTDPMGDDMERLAALQRLARSLPLIAPVDDFRLSSGFGMRKDPFTRQPAFHSGLDFGAARGSKVMAAAPGRVIHAGRMGDYGNLVEIDHGMGVVTRYAHLKAIEVEVGDEVEMRQGIGVIGSTGRSTARHLHYEVRIDDAPHDPAKFLEAGRYLVGVFGLAQLHQAAHGDD
jgi:murein DD-endopeptidase MepM/ murein hydrolase activator NlpD